MLGNRIGARRGLRLGRVERCLWFRVSISVVEGGKGGRIDDVPKGLVARVEVRGEGEGVVGVEPAVTGVAAGAGGAGGYLCVGESGHDALGTGHVRGIKGEQT